MPAVIPTPQEVVQRGLELYDRQIRSQIEAGNQGKFLVINTETGDYELDADDVIAAKRAKSRFGDALLFSMRVGHPAAYRLGSRYDNRQHQCGSGSRTARGGAWRTRIARV